MDKPNIVILSLHAGGGHIAAMNSIYASLANSDRYTPIKYISKLDHIDGMHQDLMFRYPLLYRLIYLVSSRIHSDFLHDLSLKRSLTYLEEELEPLFLDLKVEKIVSTHFLLSMALLRLRKRHGSRIELIGYVPDFDHSIIHFPSFRGLRLDKMIVQSRRLIELLKTKYHLGEEKMMIAGHLCPEDFSLVGGQSEESVFQALRQEDNLIFSQIDPAKLNIVVGGGSGWAGTITDKIDKLSKHLLQNYSCKVQFIVVSGSSTFTVSKYKKLQEKYQGTDVEIIILPNMNHTQLARVYKIADIMILSSIAPATIYELMETGVAPLILTRINPGQEKYNRGHFLGEKVIVSIEDQELLNEKITYWAKNPYELDELRTSMQSGYKEIISRRHLRALAMKEFLED